MGPLPPTKHDCDDFDAILYKFIEEGSIDHPDVVQWARDGASFSINDKHESLVPLIGKYFPSCHKYQTFRRKLSRFGFKRSPEDKSFEAAHFDRNHFAVNSKKRRKEAEKETSTDNPAKTLKSKPVEETHKQSARVTAATKSHEQTPESTHETASKDTKSNPQETNDGAAATHGGDDSSHTDTSKSIATEAVDEDIASEHGKSDSNMPEESTNSESPPAPKFKKLQVVFASDQDGLMYEAVIRKILYGPSNHSQIPVGIASTEEEYARVMGHDDDEVVWHYFVHFNKWNVNWDRWVPEHRISDISDKSKQYAKRLQEEHRSLTKQMTKKRSGKKGWQTIDGTEFLQAWRVRLTAISAEMKRGITVTRTFENVSEGTAESRRPKGGGTWTKAALALEKNLRMQGLSGKRHQSEASKIALPFSLKKILVEEWEIISQCHMLPSIPAKVSVRGVLDHYLLSKGIQVSTSNLVDLQLINTPLEGDDGDGKLTSNHTPNAREAPSESDSHGMRTAVEASNAVCQTQDESSGSKSLADVSGHPGSAQETPALGGTKAMDKTKDLELSSAPTTATIEIGTQLSTRSTTEVRSEQEQDWIDMANGLALFFEEALDTRLLYQEELPQARVLMTQSPYKDLPCSELYGCEHLLRLFVRLPEILQNELSEEETRPIFAKINDFVRYLHKNQAELLKQTYRKLTDLEFKEQQKLIKLEAKRRQAGVNDSRIAPSVKG